MSDRGADGAPSPRRDPHPELSAPIVDLSLEARIAQAEQAVKDRDVRVRGGARRIGEIANAERGRLIQRAAMVGAIGLAVGAGYAGYKAWSKRRSSRTAATEREPARQARDPLALADLTALAQVALQWAMKLHLEQGMVGTLFGAIRKGLWTSRPAEPEVHQPSALRPTSEPFAPDRSSSGDGVR